MQSPRSSVTTFVYAIVILAPGGLAGLVGGFLLSPAAGVGVGFGASVVSATGLWCYLKGRTTVSAVTTSNSPRQPPVPERGLGNFKLDSLASAAVSPLGVTRSVGAVTIHLIDAPVPANIPGIPSHQIRASIG